MMEYSNFADMPEIPERDDESIEDMTARGCIVAMLSVSSIMVILLLLAVLAVFLGCSPRIIDRVEMRTDTCYIQKTQRDSIYLKDSVYVKEWIQGDTVRLEITRWRDRWRERIIRDTAYVSRRDTVKVTVIQQQTKPLSGWQWFQIWAGRLALIAIAMTLTIFFIRKRILPLRSDTND